MIEDPCVVCGAESTHGCHGFKDGEVYSLYFCDRHINKRKRDANEEVLLEIPESQDESGSSSTAPETSHLESFFYGVNRDGPN